MAEQEGLLQVIDRLVCLALPSEHAAELLVDPAVFGGEVEALFEGALRLVEAQSYRSGVVQLRYRP